MAKEYLLEIIDVEKQFPGVKALDKVSLFIEPGSVHALLGENGAGKSTLMNCLFGIYRKDAGVIKKKGEIVDFKNPKDALDNGVAMVHQELNQVLARTVMENLWLGRFPTKRGVVDHKEMFRKTKEVLDQLGIDVNPKTIMNRLSVSERQMIEIAKAVSYDAEILVLDEPTSSLTDEEVEHLFKIVRTLQERGVGVIYITHKMEEVRQLCDTVTVLRDGQYVGTGKTEDLSFDEIVYMMVNRDMSQRFPDKTNEIGKTLLSVKNLTGKYAPTCQDVSFELREGEILGVAGLVGSRRTELLEIIFGLATKESGEIYLEGNKIENNRAEDGLNNGFALITEERRATGIFPEANITFNSVISNLDAYKKLFYLQTKNIEKDTKWVVDSLRVKTPNFGTRIKSLSGGNQQKVIIGRALLSSPKILLLDEPTRGIDIGTKYEIYKLIIELASQGKGIMMVSSEMPELIGVCDRILVMSNGRMSGIIERKDFKENIQEEILKLSAKYV